MLYALSVRDVLLIDRLDLELVDGLNVLTGETGAGKSIILDCLGFVLGWRGQANIVREGASQGEVEAQFSINAQSGLIALLDDAGIAVDTDEPLILRRQVSKDGRKRGFINDRPVSGELLRSVGEHLVELHGQHDDKGLLNDHTHRLLLDQFAGVETAAMAKLYKAYRDAARDYDKFVAERDDAAREFEYLDHAVGELQTLSAEAGEDEALDRKRRLMQQSEKQFGKLAELQQLLSGDGLNGVLAQSVRMADDLASALDEEGAVGELATQLSSAFDLIANASGGLDRLAQQLEFDPLVLEETEERLFAIRGAARKYQVQADQLPETLDEMRIKRDAYGDIDGTEEQLRQARDTALDKAMAEAERLSTLRQKAAAQLSTAVEAELAPLKMEHAKFAVAIEPRALGNDGVDEVRFVVKTNPGAPAGALSKIASGGELSRFLLALKIVLHGDTGAMLIFDEIDRGVGGSTADAVGRRLQKLSQAAQTLVVTHSPQVSARGARHFRVDKSLDANLTTTRVTLLDDGMRVDEIARMISGEVITDTTRAAAQSLLQG